MTKKEAFSLIKCVAKTCDPMFSEAIKTMIANETDFPLTPQQAYKYRGIGLVGVARLRQVGIVKPSVECPPSRAGIPFESLGLETKEQVRVAIDQRRLLPTKVRGYGKKTHALVLQWLKLPDSYTDTPQKLCPHCGKNLLIKVKKAS